MSKNEEVSLQKKLKNSLRKCDRLEKKNKEYLNTINSLKLEIKKKKNKYKPTEIVDNCVQTDKEEDILITEGFNNHIKDKEIQKLTKDIEIYKKEIEKLKMFNLNKKCNENEELSKIKLYDDNIKELLIKLNFKDNIIQQLEGEIDNLNEEINYKKRPGKNEIPKLNKKLKQNFEFITKLRNDLNIALVKCRYAWKLMSDKHPDIYNEYLINTYPNEHLENYSNKFDEIGNNPIKCNQKEILSSNNLWNNYLYTNI